MGETSTETRVEIEGTREDLSQNLQELRGRAGAIGRRGRFLGGIGGMAVAGAGAVLAGLLVVRRRRGGRLTAATRRLPRPLRSTAGRGARRTDRRLSEGVDAARRGGDQLSRTILRRYADERVEAEKRKNPMWRRTAEAGLKAGAAAGATQLIRKAVQGRSNGSSHPG